MSKKELVKRYLVFVLGLMLTALGIAFTTKSGLGTSPISAIPYSLSLIIPKLTIGNWTIVFSILLIVIQIIILKRDVKKIELCLQLVVSFALGYLIDLAMLCLGGYTPDIYIMKVFYLIEGCFIVGFGVFFQVIGDVVMLPGDAFVRAVAKVSKKEFGQMRMYSDIVMSAIAFALCLAFLHKLVGIREGTVIAALLIGNLVKLYSKKLVGLKTKIETWFLKD